MIKQSFVVGTGFYCGLYAAQSHPDKVPTVADPQELATRVRELLHEATKPNERAINVRRRPIYLPALVNHSFSPILLANDGSSFVQHEIRTLLPRLTPSHQPAPLSTILPKISDTTPKRPPPPDSPPNQLKCPICMETYAAIKQRGLKVVATRCGHMFCDYCLKKALSTTRWKCPNCRNTITRDPTAIIEIFDVC